MTVNLPISFCFFFNRSDKQCCGYLGFGSNEFSALVEVKESMIIPNFIETAEQVASILFNGLISSVFQTKCLPLEAEFDNTHIPTTTL